MREALGPLRASLGQVRRRAILFLFLAALVAWGLITWGSYTSYRHRRSVVELAERGRLPNERIFELLSGGINCNDQDQTCQIVTESGEPIGRPFVLPRPVAEPGRSGKDPFVDAIRAALPDLLPLIKADLAKESAALAPRIVLRDRAEAVGTLWGVLFVVLVASTFTGAEWRWGVWPTLLTHEPRRGRLLAAKLAALWITIAVGAALVLALTAGLDAVFRGISDVHAAGGPQPVTLARVFGRSLLSLELYATAAAAFAMIIRTSFAGIGALLLLLGDGLLSRRFIWLRHFSPSQQVATLLPGSVLDDRPGYAWWPLIQTGPPRCATDPGGGISCSDFPPLPPIPHWRASLVLGGWLIAFALAAWAVLRARDVPQ